MKALRLFPTFSLLVLTLLFSACDQSNIPTTSLSGDLEDIAVRQNGEIIPGQYIVVLKAPEEFAGKTSRQILDEMISSNGVDEMYRYESALLGFAGTFTSAAISRLRNHPLVDYIENDRVITLPPFSTLGRCDKNPDKPGCPGSGDGGEDTSAETESQSTPWGITRVAGGVNGSGTTAWVIDTGIDLDHRDLNVNSGMDKSFLTGRQSDNPDDQNGHGTHVAGTIAAIDNSFDVVGVAAGATVVSVRVLDRRGSGTVSGVIAGVNYVAKYAGNGDVANMSLGGSVSEALDEAVIAAAESGVKFALAAGNASDYANNHSPARANHANIFTISAIDSEDKFAWFSNFGNPPIEFAAPGVSVLSLWKNGGTNTISGTSMAAPHVAGILLLGAVKSGGTVVSGDPDGNPDTIATH